MRDRNADLPVREQLPVGERTYGYVPLAALAARYPDVATLPFGLKLLLENALRHDDDSDAARADVEALATWTPAAARREIAYRPARVLLQDFTGVPCVVDLAAMRDALVALGGDAARVEPQQPVELVIDHSVQVDRFGSPGAFAMNAELELARNVERYQFLKWGQQAFENMRVVPPDTGIVHQVNIEYLARIVFGFERDGSLAYPDSVVGTDSHTTMANGLGILAWGVGGIEAEAAMLGQPISMLVPEVVGVRVTGTLREGVTATDLVLLVTQRLRAVGVVGAFVEFYGPGVAELGVADRVTIGNMSPEYGSTVALFPIDARTLEYLTLTGRPPEQIALVEAYARAQGWFWEPGVPEPRVGRRLDLDLGDVEPSLAGPRRPQDRVTLGGVRASFADALAKRPAREAVPPTPIVALVPPGPSSVATLPRVAAELTDGAVIIAAITSCTNTSNPSVMLGAGLLAKKAVERGLQRKPWVKTSLAPGSQVVTDYLRAAGLTPYLNALGFDLVGYGCTTCIGNSGPLDPEVAAAVTSRDLFVAAVLSGNRNFEGRIHPLVRANFLASPPLVVAYALAGTVDIDLATEPLGTDRDGVPVLLAELWPSSAEIATAVASAVTQAAFRARYADVYAGDAAWAALAAPPGERFAWDPASEYVKAPPYFEGVGPEPAPLRPVAGARALAVLGDGVTTDHISPAGSIAQASPAARYLEAHGVARADFNSYGARRGNHEVMVRGTFANTRLRNALVPGVEGGVTRYLPTGEQLPIFDAAERYRADGTPVIVFGGHDYGAGSSRDWAAKGPMLLGVRAVIARSFERIHRSNLVGMGVLPLEFAPGDDVASLRLTGEEHFEIVGAAGPLLPGASLDVIATAADGGTTRFTTRLRIDTPVEAEYVRHGGILPFVLRGIAERG